MNTIKVIIDRFEGPYAVCEKEDKSMMDIKRINIPRDAKEGSVLIIEQNGIFIDKEETEKRKNKTKNITKDLWK
ncbi:DUF3006 domain-containing protein [Clostridium tyrobutyricum]|uniref:DUF3006 domain-containing protein n=1 Tax=Clostridium tyrobutyricum TaxID=1519 RepID=UPI001C3959E4|nr:DUF3006 domain-containing protein [Clostridium tyrobutyricum]